MPLQGPYPERGDLIEFFRPGYKHWAVYVGKGYVVHLSDLTGLSSLSSAFGGTVVVRKEPLLQVANGCVYRVNNKDDNKRIPYPPDIIVQSALKEVGEIKEYSLTSHNCEHFSTRLRYGNGFSDQVDDAVKYTIIATVGIALIGLIAGTVSTLGNKKQDSRR
ncbi:phospholipase A and acyltransferase 3-like [Anomaloglossus baeobatrachus]|uniref:phospholipase A and acyltransferase 3-like n=1 Tax=Anomaloglossus baeobatrachus TaxID=238106 RepID=UPI003F501904